MKKERYWFFSYSYTSDSGNGFGNLTFTSNGMPTKKNIQLTCQSNVTEKFPELKNINAVIISWNELKKTDYEDFNNN